MPDFANPTTPSTSPPPTDFSKITSSAPLSNVTSSSQQRPEPATRANDPNQERREDRIKRENLLRYYDAEYSHAKRELDTVNKELNELENDIRNEEKEVDILENEQSELQIKLKRIEKSLKRFKFDLRVDKGDQMEKRVVQRRWQDAFREAEAKLKKIKYGDWRALRH